MPRISPAKLYAQLGKRDSLHFNNVVETVANTSQMIFGAVTWTCMAPAVRSEVETRSHTLRSSGTPPVCNVPEATPASSDEDDTKEARKVRFNLPPVGAAEKAIVASAFNKEKDHLVASATCRTIASRTTNCGEETGWRSHRASVQSATSCRSDRNHLRLRVQ